MKTHKLIHGSYISDMALSISKGDSVLGYYSWIGKGDIIFSWE